MTAKTLARKLPTAAALARQITALAKKGANLPGHPRTGMEIASAHDVNGYIALVDVRGWETFATPEQVAAMIAAAR